MSLWPKTREELNTIVNRHFETPEYRQFFSVKLTPARESILNLHYPHYIKSRRDCWAAAQVKAPLDVKRAIWEHEKDELIFDKRMGSAHLTDDQMAAATAESNLLPGARAAIFASTGLGLKLRAVCITCEHETTIRRLRDSLRVMRLTWIPGDPNLNRPINSALAIRLCIVIHRAARC